MNELKKRPALEFDHVIKRYGKTTAVNNVSFTIEPKQMVTLLGPSGCGKTSTLRLIAGLELVSEGKIYLDGEDVTLSSAAERDVSMVFQSYALFPHMTVQDNVAFGLVVAGEPRARANERALESLRLVGLAEFAARFPNELSGGQQQRVAVARSLVLQPKVLLLDEPLSNLDTKLRRRVRDEIRDIQQKLGLTAVYVTHDQEEALAISDQIIVMNRQVIAQKGSPRELFEAPADEFVADFICNANIVSGVIEDVRDGIAECRIGGLTVRLPSRRNTVGEARIAIRPEGIRLRKPNAESRMVVRVARSTYLGREMQYTLETPMGELFAVSHDFHEVFVQGSEAELNIYPQGAAIIGGAA
ncbi:MAG TPA: ABC transporter ATP-binding protein [Noviherbaspirillum sp.]